MVMIPQIQDSVLPEGHVEIMRRAQAKAEDFGGQVAQAQAGFGKDIAEGASALQDHLEIQDVTNVYTKMAQARADWTQNLKDRVNQTTPGDQTLVPGMVSDMDKYFQAGSEVAQTQKGQKLWTQMSAGLTAEMTEKAIGQQSYLDGQAAINNHVQMVANGTRTVENDPSQLDSVVANGFKAIDDPDGQYSRIPQTERDKFKQTFQNQASEAAARGFFRINPGAALGMLGGALAQHDPGPALAGAGAVPGGQVNLSPETLSKAPQVFPAAAATGANANLLLGQIEVGGTKEQSPEELAVSMAALQKYYQGDQQMALAAYHAGTQAVDAAVQAYGFDWAAHVPDGATSYVDSVMKVSGMAPSAPAPVDPNAPSAAPQGPAPVTQSSIPGWNNLTGQQQNTLTQFGTELRLRELAEQRRQREDAKIQQEAARNDALTTALRQIDDPRSNGAFDYKAFVNNPAVDAHAINMIDEIRQRNREKGESNANRSDPGAYRQTWLRVSAGPDAQNPITNDEIRSQVATGALSVHDGQQLINWSDQFKSADGSTFARRFAQISSVVRTGFEKDPMAIANPMAYQNAWLEWQRDAESQLDAAQKAGKDRNALLDPKSPDYLGDPKRVQTFNPGAQVLIAKAAAAQKVQPGTVLAGYRFKGGDPANQANWEKVVAPVAVPPAAPIPAKHQPGISLNFGAPPSGDGPFSLKVPS